MCSELIIKVAIKKYSVYIQWLPACWRGHLSWQTHKTLFLQFPREGPAVRCFVFLSVLRPKQSSTKMIKAEFHQIKRVVMCQCEVHTLFSQVTQSCLVNFVVYFDFSYNDLFSLLYERCTKVYFNKLQPLKAQHSTVDNIRTIPQEQIKVTLEVCGRQWSQTFLSGSGIQTTAALFSCGGRWRAALLSARCLSPVTVWEVFVALGRSPAFLGPGRNTLPWY